MSTVLDLITAALLDLGVVASGEAPTAAEAQDALRRLNLLLELWRLEQLMVYTIDTVSLPLTGAASYTWGPGGDITAPRPVRLEHMVQRLAGTTPPLDFPLFPLNHAEYESLNLKGLQSSLARWFYYDAAFPVATLRTYPVLPAGDTLLMYPWHPLQGYTALTDTVSMPPGYEMALQTNLSIHLVASYRDCQVNPVTAALAMESKALIKTANSRPYHLGMPPGMPGTGMGPGATNRAAFLAGGNA